MNNEPVAYGMLTFCKNCGEQNPYSVKELTDKEILNIAHQIRLIDRQTADDGHLYFARAILRKAQEK
jgi:hypothetical protein